MHACRALVQLQQLACSETCRLTLPFDYNFWQNKTKQKTNKQTKQKKQNQQTKKQRNKKQTNKKQNKKYQAYFVQDFRDWFFSSIFFWTTDNFSSFAFRHLRILTLFCGAIGYNTQRNTQWSDSLWLTSPDSRSQHWWKYSIFNSIRHHGYCVLAACFGAATIRGQCFFGKPAAITTAGWGTCTYEQYSDDC